MRTAQKVALAYLAALLLIAYGYSISKFQLFPYQFIVQLEKFLQDDSSAIDLSATEKLESDLNIVPHRHIVKHPLNPARKYSEVALPGPKERRLSPLVYRTTDASAGYRVILGTHDFNSGLHGAILLDARDKVVNSWTVSENGLPYQKFEETNVTPHDVEVLEDGSIIFSYVFGNSMQRLDWCGKRIWAIEGGYHHNFSRSSTGSLWTLWTPPGVGGQSLAELDEADGSVIRQISFRQIMEANPEIDIFGLRQRDGDHEFKWMMDYWHENDVDVLSSELADKFEQFSAGDLLISFRSINLIFVLNPDDLRVKWWRVGLARRQHDPDWLADGTISIYDNNMHRGISRIVNVNPATFESKIVYSGEKENFYSFRKGNHQVLDNGNLLIAASEQGRVLEVDPMGNTVYEYINRYQDEENLNLMIADVVHLPEAYFNIDQFGPCQTP